ncbi:BTB/POZ domain-containing protein 6-B-like [Ruditapes philippinarum]|uniref:BTB/POZ domain-containing protein 6-B-like n=1 Tax=Ruditapes philippinarum TaxID=129788 RepID=UPI00295C1600|nr:BTB/POZ domain-containing protein 6-B-like [Ruditapes philippinarum]
MECLKEPAWQSNRLFEETNWRMLQNERLCDVTFLVGSGKEEKIMAHRFILASRSPVFFTMFCGSLPETNKTVDVPDIEPAIFRDLLRFIYTEDCSINENNVMALLYCSKKYGLERLREACQKFLNTNLSSDNVCTILQHAIQFDEVHLENRCLTFGMENAEMVLKSDGLSTISKEVLKKIIESDELIVDELCVYNACKRWAIAQCNGKSDKHERSELAQRGKLGDLIYSVRFATMSFQTFAENVAIEDILTSEEKVFVFQTIAGIASKKTSFPFQAISKKRKFRTEIVEVQRFGPNYHQTWCYGGSPDVLNFKVSIPCKIVGVSLFAPYNSEDVLEGTMSLQNDTSILTSENNIKVVYEVSKYYGNVLFDKPVDIEPDTEYTIIALLRGASTYYGSDGKVKVVSGPLEVEFSNNVKSTNSTSQSQGQFHSFSFEIKKQH